MCVANTGKKDPAVTPLKSTAVEFPSSFSVISIATPIYKAAPIVLV